MRSRRSPSPRSVTDEPRAFEHADDLPTAPPCETCGEPTELVMLERFTGWWCPRCSSAPAPSSA